MMTLGPLLTTADLDTAIADDEERLADYRLTLTDCEEAGLATAQALSLVHIVEGHLALLKERRGRLLQKQAAAP
jgi:hypothetical protein